MSNLRRSRPEEQDASLKRLQEISVTRHRLDSAEQSSPSSPGRLHQLKEEERNELFGANDLPLEVQIPEELGLLSHAAAAAAAAVAVRSSPAVVLKPRARSETSSGSGARSSTLTALPAPAGRKYRKMLSAPVSSTMRRSGSEPLLDRLSGNSLQHKMFWSLNMSEADRKWEKLRRILTAMRDEPFDVEASLSASPDVLSIQQEKINTHVELQAELETLQAALIQKNTELQKTEEERDCALAYIRHITRNSEEPVFSHESEEEFTKICEGIESLRESSVPKDNVVDMLASLVKDFHEQRSYLDRLMAVVLTRAPWMLDEVDKVELQDSQQPLFSMYDDNDDDDDDYEENDNDFQYDESDNEVLC